MKQIDISNYSGASTALIAGGTTIKLPCFFASISSVKTNYLPSEYLTILQSLGYPTILLSAYDFANTARKNQYQIRDVLAGCIKAGATILLDSGGYESYWKKDRSWKWHNYNKTLPRIPAQLSFGFDIRSDSNSLKSITRKIARAYIKDQKIPGARSIIPIVHTKNIYLPEAVFSLAQQERPLMVAVAERELGNGIISRIETVIAIRQSLNRIGDAIPLHILGTGNPYSLLLFTLAGADSFDGLEWCQTTVDPQTGVLHHFQLRQSFACSCRFCQDNGLDYTLATFGHNLHFYQNWIKLLREHRQNGTLLDLASNYFGAEFLTSVKRLMKIG